MAGPEVQGYKGRNRYRLTRNKFLTADERLQLEQVLERSLKNPAHYRDGLLLLLALHTGGRASEVLAFKRSDFNPETRSIWITGIKGSNDREIPLPKWISRELHNFCKLMAPADLLFPITYNRFRQIWLFYRPTEKKLHAVRHTFAVHVYRKTKDLRLLQIALGHRNISNTMIYMDFFYSINELRRLADD